MTRKHYVAVATIIRARRNGSALDMYRGSTVAQVRSTLDDVARDLADVFAQDNPRFDRGRFLAACGIGE